MQMPPGHEDTKFDYVEGSAVHKVLIFNELILVQLSAFVAKNVHFRVNSKVEKLKLNTSTYMHFNNIFIDIDDSLTVSRV
jgi:hypothetical protein